MSMGEMSAGEVAANYPKGTLGTELPVPIKRHNITVLQRRLKRWPDSVCQCVREKACVHAPHATSG